MATYIDHPKVPYSGFRYTRDQELHKTERYNDKGDLVYDLPINSNGDYVLILQFAEVKKNLIKILQGEFRENWPKSN